MPTNTRLEYLTSLVDRLYPDRYQRRGTASATGSTTTIVDTDAFSSSALFPSGLVGKWIWVNTADTTGKLAQITVHDRSTGTITLDRAVTSTTSSTTWWITFERNPQELFDAINQVLRNTYAPRMFPLTSLFVLENSVPDNDMEESGATTWTAVTSGTATKSAYSAGLGFPHGTQMLEVSSGAADGVYESSVISAGHQYWASVFVASKVDDAADFTIYDASNSAIIENATTDEQEWMNLSFYFTPPANCEQIQARLLGVAASATTYWKDISIINCDQKIFRTPNWLTKEEQMINVFEMPLGASGPGGDNEYRVFESDLRAVPWTPAYNTIVSTNELALQVEGFCGNPRYIYAMGPGVALSTDASTGYVDVDIVTENALTILKHPEQADRFLRRLREGSMNASHSTPTLQGMAYFA